MILFLFITFFICCFADNSCGDSCQWNYVSETSTLTISGSGTMTDFGAYSNTPWYNYITTVEIIDIGDDITHWFKCI